MKSTRDRILQTLLNQPRSTIQELAEAVGINGISVRHHINSLKAENLIKEEEERHGVGRPRLIYMLTNEGLERFPTRYLQLTNRLLVQMKESLPEAVVNNLFKELAAGLASESAQKARKLPFEEKLNLLQDVLFNEGFTIEWNREGDNYIIRETSCPYLHIGQAHPEVCMVDQTLISTVLSIPAENIRCILRGDGNCTFSVPASIISESKS